MDKNQNYKRLGDIQNLEVTAATSLNIEQILNTNHIILSNTGLELITLTYGKS